MNNRSTGIIATIAAVLLCGCPGLFLCLFGALTAAGQGKFNEASLSPAVGFTLLCVALIMLLIPVGVGFFTLRKRGDNTPPPSSSL
jgi:hypothetical protein